MILYHGTTEAAARRALQVGLQPRALSKTSNWNHTTKSHPWMVYLTDIYAPYFASCAVMAADTSKAAILEIDIDSELLNVGWLRPDEDFLAQVWKMQDGEKRSLARLTEIARKQVESHAQHWLESLKHLGTAAYKGTIPSAAIRRVSYFDVDAVPKHLALAAINPSITIANHRFCADKYRTLNSWYMGDKVDATDMVRSSYMGFADAQIKALVGDDTFAQQVQMLEDMLAQRPMSVEVFHNIPVGIDDKIEAALKGKS